MIHELEQELNQILTQKPQHQSSVTVPNTIYQQVSHEIEHDTNDFIEKLTNHKLSSPRSNRSSNATVENKRYQNLTLQKHIDHDNLSVHSADVPGMKNVNRQFSANLRKVNETDRQTTSNELKDLQPFLSSSLSSFQNQDAKSDSGNGSSCNEQRITPTFKNGETHIMTSSSTSTASSSQSKHISYEEQHQQGSSSPKVTTNYKYTPLRQSWSNLNQINQLSPFSFNQSEQDVDITSSEPIVKSNSSSVTRKERPTSASNIILRTNMLLSALNDNKQSNRRTENDFLNALNNSNDTSNNTLRSFSVNHGYDKDLPSETNRYSSLPRSSTTTNTALQQTNPKLLTIPNKARPYSAGSNSNSSPSIGLSIYKDSPATSVQTIEAKAMLNYKTAATITTNNNNYNYAIESDYYDQFTDDNLPVKELDVSTSTVSSSVSAAILNNKKPSTATPPTNGSNMLSTYQKLRTSVHSGSYRPTTTAPTVSNSNPIISNKKSAVTISSATGSKTNGGESVAPTSSSYRQQPTTNGNKINGESVAPTSSSYRQQPNTNGVTKEFLNSKNQVSQQQQHLRKTKI